MLAQNGTFAVCGGLFCAMAFGWPCARLSAKHYPHTELRSKQLCHPCRSYASAHVSFHLAVYLRTKIELSFFCDCGMSEDAADF